LIGKRSSYVRDGSFVASLEKIESFVDIRALAIKFREQKKKAARRKLQLNRGMLLGEEGGGKWARVEVGGRGKAIAEDERAIEVDGAIDERAVACAEVLAELGEDGVEGIEAIESADVLFDGDGGVFVVAFVRG
jgi:hypothetical protein